MRVAALLGATAVLVLGSVAAPAAACACGAPAPLPGYDVDVDRENAIVRWDGELEEIVMQLDMRSDAGETGLVVPTPNPATVSLGDSAVFDALEQQILPQPEVEWDWWGPSLLDGAGSAGGAAPEVLARVQLGPIEAVTLAASDSQGLTAWLSDNGYALSDAATAELPQYVTDGWSFVALRLTGDVPFDGELDPIRFTFASDSLVYPMRMSHAAAAEQNVRLYVLTEHRAVVTAPDGDALVADLNRTTWAGPVTNAEVAPLGAYLTVIDLEFTDPGTQITSDFEISDAPTDDLVFTTYTDTRLVNVLGIPAGPLLVFIGIVAAIVLVVVLVRRRARAS